MFIATPGRNVPFQPGQNDHFRMLAASSLNGFKILRGSSLKIPVRVISDGDDFTAKGLGFEHHVFDGVTAVRKGCVNMGVGLHPDAFFRPIYLLDEMRLNSA